jgi:hypothetical protein
MQQAYQVVFYDSSQSTSHCIFFRRELEHLNVVLLHQVFDDEVRVRDCLAVVVGDPRRLALGSDRILEICIETTS